VRAERLERAVVVSRLIPLSEFILLFVRAGAGPQAMIRALSANPLSSDPVQIWLASGTVR
jgi:hypothetical protein